MHVVQALPLLVDLFAEAPQGKVAFHAQRLHVAGGQHFEGAALGEESCPRFGTAKIPGGGVRCLQVEQGDAVLDRSQSLLNVRGHVRVSCCAGM